MNFAIIGYSDHLISKVLPAIFNNNDRCLAIVSSSISNHRIEFDNKIISIFQDISSLKDSKLDIDCIYISTPIATHYKLAKQSLELGYNVICEKPLSTNYKDSRELFNIASRNELFLFEVNMHMHHYQFRLFDLLFRRGKPSPYLGKIQKVILSFCIPHFKEDNFRYNPELGAGAIYDIGFYPISSMLSLEENPQEMFVFLQSQEGKNGAFNKSGTVFFAGTKSITFELRWSMGQKYENFCHIIYENGDIFFDRFFSKPNNFNSSTIFSFRNKSYTKKIVENNFENMFKEIRNILSTKEDNLHNYKIYKDITLRTAKLFDKYSTNSSITS